MERKAIHAYITAKSHSCWQDFSAANGITMSAILEIIGRKLNHTADDIPWDKFLEKLVIDARALDAERRFYRKNRDTKL